MRSAAVAVLVVGCFSPRTPSGVVCDPLAPVCPDGQQCRPEGGSHVCKEPGVDEPDAALADAALPHVELAAGYSAAVFQDFSSAFTYDANDWPEETETFDNQPSYLFSLDAPFPRALGVIAGREILALTGTGVPEVHDFGEHPPNTVGLPDHLTGAQYVTDLDGGGPAILVSSSSEDGGDGSYRIDAAWNVTLDLSLNNTRSLLVIPPSTFDSRLTVERFLGAQQGIVRRSDSESIATGDTRSMRVVGSDLYVTRTVGTQDQLVRISSVVHDETMLATRTRFRLVEGTPPEGWVAWALVDAKQLVLVAADGEVEVVAELTDLAYRWTGAVAPPTGHPLAGTLYVLESNRALDLDRVLAITRP